MAEPAKNIHDEDQESPLFDSDTPQGIYDDEFDRMQKRGLVGKDPEKSLSPEELEKAEEKGAGDQDSIEPEDEEESFYNPNDDPGGRFRRAKTTKGLLKKRRKLFIGGGIAMAFLGGLFAIFSFLMPFKLFHIIQTIEQKVGNVPGYAIDRRMDYYMNRYLIVRQLQASGLIDENGKGRDGYIYIGEGTFKTLYTNWRGAKLEVKMKEKYGIRITANLGQGDLAGRRYLAPSNWTVNLERSGKSFNLGNSKEARALINDFVKTETRSHQVIKRQHMRKILKNYYGVNNWKIFEKQRDKARLSYREKKLALKRYLVKQTVGRISSRYSKWMICLLEGGERCKEIRKGETAGNSRDKIKEGDKEFDGSKDARQAAEKGVGEIAEEVEIKGIFDREAAKETGRISEKVLAKEITETVQKVGLKKVLASFAAGIGIVDTIAQIVKSIDDGALNIVVYDKNAQQYAAFAAPMLSMADQIRSGEDIDADDVRVATEIYDNFETSPVYQRAASGGNSSAATGQVRRDCDGDGTTTGKEDLLESGETVCPDKRLVQDQTTFTSNGGWQTLSKIAAGYRSTAGKIVGAFTGLVNKVFDITGLDSVIQGVMDATGIGDLVASGFKWIMNRIAGPVITGAETGPDAYDALYAGMAVQKSSLGGGVGANREETIGGAYLSDEQVAAIQTEESDIDHYAQQHRSLFDRYFSPYNSSSLTAKIALKTPSSLSEASQKFAQFTTKPLGLFSSLGQLWSPKVSAQSYQAYNPFHAIYYGYATNDPVFDMEPEDLHQKYQCDKPAAERPQNQVYARPGGLPFDVATQTDPCLLEKVVSEAGSMYFSGNYDEGF